MFDDYDYGYGHGYRPQDHPLELNRLLLFLLVIPTIFWYAGALDGDF